jgi:hypothetical protein
MPMVSVSGWLLVSQDHFSSDFKIKITEWLIALRSYHALRDREEDQTT